MPDARMAKDAGRWARTISRTKVARLEQAIHERSASRGSYLGDAATYESAPAKPPRGRNKHTSEVGNNKR